MTVLEANAILERLTYRPVADEWFEALLRTTRSPRPRFRVLEDEFSWEDGEHRVSIEFFEIVQQVDAPRFIQVGVTERIRPKDFQKLSPSELLKIIRQMVHKFEVHEADEWLKLDGQALFDPHEVPKTQLINRLDNRRWEWLEALTHPLSFLSSFREESNREKPQPNTK